MNDGELILFFFGCVAIGFVISRLGKRVWLWFHFPEVPAELAIHLLQFMQVDDERVRPDRKRPILINPEVIISVEPTGNEQVCKINWVNGDPIFVVGSLQEVADKVNDA